MRWRVVCKAGLGEVEEAWATATSISQELPPPDTLVGSVKFASGTCSSVSVTFAGSVLRFSLSVTGTKGSLEVWPNRGQSYFKPCSAFAWKTFAAKACATAVRQPAPLPSCQAFPTISALVTLLCPAQHCLMLYAALQVCEDLPHHKTYSLSSFTHTSCICQSSVFSMKHVLLSITWRLE